MIKFHPSHAQLKAFVKGQLNVNTALLISSHIDMCEQCQQTCQEIEQGLAEEAFGIGDSLISEVVRTSVSNEAALPADLNAMFDQIVSLPSQTEESSMIHAKTTIELDGKPFPIPRALKRVVPEQPKWSKLAGKVWHAPVPVGDSENIHFIFMEQGAQVPEHSHRGTEYSLVLDGEFSDEAGRYLTGDFTALNQAHTHRPYTEHGDGCLVLSVVDKPLQFTSGIARLLNPFSHLFFK